MEEKKLHTTPEVAQALGVSASHVRNMVRTGKAKPHQRLGNNWLFTIEEIERLRGRKRTPGRVKK
jgi:excisionase family DNA binding protein